MGRQDYVPLYWCTVPIPSRRSIPITLASDEHEPWLTGTHKVTGGERAGFFDSNEWRIVIWAGSEKRDYPRLLFHELNHAVLDDLGVVPDLTEDKMLCALDHSMAAILRRQGWKPPPLPYGWRQLAIHSRWVRYGRKQAG